MLILKYRCIITAYYGEFIGVNDYKCIHSICQTLSKKYLPIQAYLESFPAYINEMINDKNQLKDIQTWCQASLSLLEAHADEPSQSVEEEMNKLHGFYYADYNNNSNSISANTSDNNNNNNNNAKSEKISNQRKLSKNLFVPLLNMSDNVTDKINGCLNFEGYRLNFERALYLISSSTLAYFNTSDKDLFMTLVQRMNASYWRSLYLDSISDLLGIYAIPYEINWYRTHFLTAHVVSFNHMAGQNYPYESFKFLELTKFITFNCHKDVTEELPVLIDTAINTSQGMIQLLKTHVVNQLDHLYELLTDLENQTRPIEAGIRLQKSIDSRRKGLVSGFTRKKNANNSDPLPGSESEIWGKMSITRLKSIRNNINQIMSYIQKHRFFMTYTRQYDFYQIIFLTIKDYLDKRYQSIYFSVVTATSNNPATGITNNTFERMTYAKIKFTSYCRAIQSVFACTQLSHEFPDMLRQLLCREIFEYNIPFPGHKIPHNLTTEHIFGIPSSMILNHGTNIAMNTYNNNNKQLRTTPSDAASNAALAVSASNLTTGNLHSKFRSIMNTADSPLKPENGEKLLVPLIWRITAWFESIIDALTHPKSVHMYNDKTESIVPLPTTRYAYQTSSEIDTKVTYYMYKYI
jgi:hypothetical protein